ncbi:MAG: hypothetical protein WCV58_04140 [Patescibacteria group bacterium]|jgi:hypothetical protein
MRSVILAVFVVVFVVSGCGGGGGGKSVFDDPTTANSPHGSCSFEDRAYSPDGEYYTQLDRTHFMVSVYLKNGQYHLSLLGSGFDLKGMCWSRDNKHIVLMYHNASGNWLHYYSSEDGKLIKMLGPNEISSGGYYHYLVFSPEGDYLYLSYKGESIDYKFTPNFLPA